MKNYNETINSLISELSHEAQELLEYPRDLYEASHEHADNHEDVIYTAKAHDNVRNASGEELAEAENRFEELGGVPEGGVNGASAYDSTAILLSFHLEEFRFQETVRNDLEPFQDSLEELENEINGEIEECEDTIEHCSHDDVIEENEREKEALEAVNETIAGHLNSIREILNQ